MMLALLDSCGLLLAIPILTVGILLITKLNIYCVTFLEKPLIAIGVLLVVVSIAGLFAAFVHKEWLIWVHMFALFLLVILIFCFAVFAVNITSGGSGHPVPGTNYSDYALDDSYPQWMRHRVEEKDEWRDAVTCMKKNGYCTTRLPYNGADQSLYNQSHLSSIQSGCCKPPSACQFEYVSAIDWVQGPASTPQASPDCTSWSNDSSMLCYECSSCKAGLVEAVKQRWKKAGIMLFIVLGILIVLILGYLATDRGHH